MITVGDIRKNYKFPSFIREFSGLSAGTKIEKVFPHIGLKNCSIKVDNIGNVKDISSVIVDAVNDRVNYFTQDMDLEFLDRYGSDTGDGNIKYTQHEAVLASIFNILTHLSESKLTFSKGKLSSSINIKDAFGKILLKKGQDLGKFLNEIDKACEKLKLKFSFNYNQIIKLANFNNSESFNLFFSSDGIRGAWDIATMSMRGISSCQRWGAGHEKCLIGSILDPFTGIIYLSSNDNTDYGKKMFARSIVRFIVKENKPFLFIERPYGLYEESEEVNNNHIDDMIGNLGNFYNKNSFNEWALDYLWDANIDYSTNSLKIFSDFLKKTVKGKYEILSYNEVHDKHKYKIPLSTSVETLTDNTRSYRDSHINYESSPKYNKFHNLYLKGK